MLQTNFRCYEGRFVPKWSALYISRWKLLSVYYFIRFFLQFPLWLGCKEWGIKTCSVHNRSRLFYAYLIYPSTSGISIGINRHCVKEKDRPSRESKHCQSLKIMSHSAFLEKPFKLNFHFCWLLVNNVLVLDRCRHCGHVLCLQNGAK